MAHGTNNDMETVASWEHAVVYSTPRLVIRQFDPEDWRALQGFAGRLDVAKMMGSVHSPWSQEQILNWMKKTLFRGKIGFRVGIYLNGTLIGFIGIGGSPVSIGYAIDPDYHGNGFATEAVRGMLSYAFEQHDLPEVHADIFEDNPVSGLVLTKVGFEKIGSGMSESVARLEPAPNLLYRLTQTQWKAIRNEVS